MSWALSEFFLNFKSLSSIVFIFFFLLLVYLRIKLDFNFSKTIYKLNITIIADSHCLSRASRWRQPKPIVNQEEKLELESRPKRKKPQHTIMGAPHSLSFFDHFHVMTEITGWLTITSAGSITQSSRPDYKSFVR